MTAILTDGTFNRHLTFLYCYKGAINHVAKVFIFKGQL